MAIKNAEYQIKESGGFNVYHYTTNSGAVKILDSNKNILGTLNEFSFEGKIVESGSFKDLKISGLYKVKGVSDLPEEIQDGKIALLQVKAVGKINQPEFINYQVIYPNGTIYNKTVVGSNESSWSNGGTKLENTITTQKYEVAFFTFGSFDFWNATNFLFPRFQTGIALHHKFWKQPLFRR